MQAREEEIAEEQKQLAELQLNRQSAIVNGTQAVEKAEEESKVAQDATAAALVAQQETTAAVNKVAENLGNAKARMQMALDNRKTSQQREKAAGRAVDNLEQRAIVRASREATLDKRLAMV